VPRHPSFLLKIKITILDLSLSLWLMKRVYKPCSPIRERERERKKEREGERKKEREGERAKWAKFKPTFDLQWNFCLLCVQVTRRFELKKFA
jgi:hypothetical protein